MTFRKRLRVIWSAVTQEWHDNVCGECGHVYLAVGPARPELIHICDGCELKEMERFMAHAEREYQRQTRGARG